MGVQEMLREMNGVPQVQEEDVFLLDPENGLDVVSWCHYLSASDTEQDEKPAAAGGL